MFDAKLFPITFALALTIFAGCKKDEPPAPEKVVFAPAISVELMAPQLGGLLLEKSTQAELLAFLPTASVSRDRSLGGDMAVSWNELPAITGQIDDSMYNNATDAIRRANFTLVSLGDEPRLIEIELSFDMAHAPSPCDWVQRTFSAVEEAKNCAGAFSTHEQGDDAMSYCIGNADQSKPIIVSCKRIERDGRKLEQLAYRLENPRKN